MNGYGEWVQLSVFQCRLSRRHRIELESALGEIIDHAQDQS
jgi:CRISPR-associated protein Cas2